MIDIDPLDRLERLRSSRRHRRIAMGTGALVGLLVAQVHWIGVVLGGVIVGLAARSLRRALLVGLGFGLLVVVGFLAALGWNGTLVAAVGMGPILVLSLAIPILAASLGALVHGVVPVEARDGLTAGTATAGDPSTEQALGESDASGSAPPDTPASNATADAATDGDTGSVSDDAAGEGDNDNTEQTAN